MDLQAIFAVNMLAICALLALAELFYRFKSTPSFFVVNLLIIAVGAWMIWRRPDYSGVVVAALFLPFVAAPAVLGLLFARAVRLGKPEQAARFARWLAFTHPSPTLRRSAAIATANAIADPQARARAVAEVARDAPPHEAAMLEARRLVEARDWSALLALCQNPTSAIGPNAFTLRALGELRRIDDLMSAYEGMTSDLPIDQTTTAWLFVLAFGGRPDAVDRLLRKTLRLEPGVAEYWRAIARLHAGAAEEARLSLERIATKGSASPAVSAAQAMLQEGRSSVLPLTRGSEAIVDGVANRAARECARRERDWRRMIATWLLIAANSAMFVTEMSMGGSEDAETLVSLGALAAPLVTEAHEYWRVIAAAFLHYGPVHFGMNMLMLGLIGRDVELEFGSVRTSFVYLLGAVASSSFVLAVMTQEQVRYGVYVGASGAIFSLFGVVCVSRFRQWRGERSRLDAFGLAALALVMAVQIGADLVLPMSSMAGHMSGFAFGLAAGFVLTWRRGGGFTPR